MRFGFTASEAEELASRRGLPPCRLPQMRDWYDGYCFGGTDVGQLYLAGYATTDDVAVPNDAMREHGRGRLRRFLENRGPAWDRILVGSEVPKLKEVGPWT